MFLPKTRCELQCWPLFPEFCSGSLVGSPAVWRFVQTLGTGQNDDTHIVKKQGTMRILSYAAFSAARANRRDRNFL